MFDLWTNYYPQNEDIIMKTPKGFIIETDNHKTTILKTLTTMENEGVIVSFEETRVSIKPTTTKNDSLHIQL